MYRLIKKYNLRKLYIALILLFFTLCIGMIGFVVIEGYTLLQAFFMTIITISTVGFGEIRPLSENGLIFTSFLIIFSFGIFAYVISSVTSYVLDGEFKIFLKYRKMIKAISKINDHIIICGYGRNGIQAVHELLDHGESVIVIEKSEDVVYQASEEHPKLIFINGDATQDDVLDRAKLQDAKALITTFPSDADNLFVVITARSINKHMTIISRASDDHSIVKLKRVGANNVILPDKVGGSRMAKLVVQPDIVEFLEQILLKSGDAVNLEEIFCSDLSSCMMNKTIGELDIRKVSGANLVGLKLANNTYVFNPSPDIKLSPNDKLFVMGTNKQIETLKKIIIDDIREIDY